MTDKWIPFYRLNTVHPFWVARRNPHNFIGQERPSVLRYYFISSLDHFDPITTNACYVAAPAAEERPTQAR